MISYFNYEINYNLDKLKKINLINNKNISKKNKLKSEKINAVNNLPHQQIPIIFDSYKIVENAFNADEYYKPNIVIDQLGIKKCKVHVTFPGSDIVEGIPNNANIIAKHLKNKIIHLVYQYKYKNKSATGFGDFLRSIYFMTQLSEKYNLKFEININKHDIKKYIEHFRTKKDLDTFSNNIEFFDKGNHIPLKINNVIKYTYIDIDEYLLNYINNLHSYGNDIYLYLINHPNKDMITESHKEFVRNTIKPTEELNQYIDDFLFNLNLQKHNFITIHVRYYDESSSINEAFIKSMNYIIQTISFIKTKYQLDILLLTSNNKIKYQLIKLMPSIKTHFNSICHTCKNGSTDEEIKNTLKDFYVMSYSKSIYSFSVYEHGSGFSEWCATTYNIPYICYSIQ